MKMTKSELKEMIRECLREALNEGAFAGGYAEGGSLDTSKRAGGAPKVWKNALEGKKTKTVLAKDLKPGMITCTGKVVSVTDAGWYAGKPSVEVGYGGIGAQGSYASDLVAEDREYEVLDESVEEDVFEGLFDFGSKKRKEQETKRADVEDRVNGSKVPYESEYDRMERERRERESDRYIASVRKAGQSWRDGLNAKDDGPSNTQYAGVNYSGGDYF